MPRERWCGKLRCGCSHSPAFQRSISCGNLGRLPFPHGSPVGMVAGRDGRARAVGAAWALFYAYFFWARLNWPPPLQGLAFAALPAPLATFVVYPQLQLMHLDQSVVQLDWHQFLVGLGKTEILPGAARPRLVRFDCRARSTLGRSAIRRCATVPSHAHLTAPRHRKRASEATNTASSSQRESSAVTPRPSTGAGDATR